MALKMRSKLLVISCFIDLIQYILYFRRKGGKPRSSKSKASEEENDKNDDVKVSPEHVLKIIDFRLLHFFRCD